MRTVFSDASIRRQRALRFVFAAEFKGVTPRLLPLLIAERFLEDETITSVVMEMAEMAFDPRYFDLTPKEWMEVDLGDYARSDPRRRSGDSGRCGAPDAAGTARGRHRRVARLA